MAARHTLVIGGTRGIGRAVVRRFVEDGDTVSVVGRTLGKSRSPHVHHFAADLGETETFGATLDEIVRSNGRLSNLVFLQRFRGDGDEWEDELAVSLTATRFVVEHLRERFVARRGGAIVIVTSNASRLVASEQGVAYHAAKAALRQMARYYAVELGPARIRVNCVSPGTVLKDESRQFYAAQEKLQDLYRRVTPLGRMGEASEIAAVIAFLCGPDASFVTGHDLVVDGGLSLLWQESLARDAAGLTKAKRRR